MGLSANPRHITIILIAAIFATVLYYNFWNGNFDSEPLPLHRSIRTNKTNLQNEIHKEAGATISNKNTKKKVMTNKTNLQNKNGATLSNKETKKKFYTRKSDMAFDKYSLLRTSSQVRFEKCKTFHFSPADWTLYELQEYDHKLENETCNKLYESLFNETLLFMGNKKRPQKRVKWIVHRDKTITTLGCTKHSRHCEPGSFYDYQCQMRIDTPPCCRQKLMEITEHLSEYYNKNNVSFLYIGGFVIGYARSKSILNYDENGDLFVEQKHWQSPEIRKSMDELTQKYGYYQEWRKSDHSKNM